jgi:hypothetical protein
VWCVPNRTYGNAVFCHLSRTHVDSARLSNRVCCWCDEGVQRDLWTFNT